jgi:glucokinase
MAEDRTLVPLTEAVPPFFVGIDLGGTTIKGGVIDDQGRILSWRAIPTRVPEGADAATQRMGQLVRDVIQDAGLSAAKVEGVGLGSPGTLDVPTGMLVVPVNLTGWNHYPIRDRLHEYCGLDITFANDANAAAYGEFWIGSGKQYPSMILLTLGTGIGGGIIIDHMSIDGENSHGSECGHIIIDYHEDARRCNCGKKGHLEPYCSAYGIIKRTEEAIDSGRESAISKHLASGERLTPLLVAQAAEAGDALANDVIMETARYLGIGIVSMTHVIDPAAVILGGAMTFGREETEIGRRFLARVRQEVQQRAFPVVADRVKILYATLGGDAGFIGAAGRARLEYRRKKGLGN